MALSDPDEPGFLSGASDAAWPRPTPKESPGYPGIRSKPVRPRIATTPDDTAGYVSTGGRLVIAEWQSTMAEAHVGYVRERSGMLLFARRMSCVGVARIMTPCRRQGVNFEAPLTS